MLTVNCGCEILLLGRIPMRQLVYRVQALPQSMLPLVWDFGQLSTDVEKLYIRQMVLHYVSVLHSCSRRDWYFGVLYCTLVSAVTGCSHLHDLSQFSFPNHHISSPVFTLSSVYVVFLQQSFFPFLLRDAMLAWYVLWPCARLSVCPSICHESEFYQNRWTNRANFRHGSFLRLILCCIVRKFRYLPKIRILPLELCLKLRT